MVVMLLALVGCLPSAPLEASMPPRLPAGVATVPVDPGTIPSPYDAALEVPDLTRRASGLDLETLGWHETTYHVEVDLSAIGRVPAERARELMVRFAADPRWRVGVWDGAVVAFQRQLEAGTWSVPRHGYHADDTSVWRTAVRFTPWQPGSAWSSRDLVTVAPATQRKLDLRAFELLGGPAAGLEATALTVQGSAVSVDLFEATEDEQRPRTSEALSEVPFVVEAMAGSAWRGVAADPGRFEDPHLEVRSQGAGVLEFEGRVAATKPGWAWIRVLDEKGRAWEETAVGVGTRQLVYGAADENRRSYVQSEFPVPAGPAFRGKAQVWHAPLDGGAPEMLASYDVTVPAR